MLRLKNGKIEINIGNDAEGVVVIFFNTMKTRGSFKGDAIGVIEGFRETNFTVVARCVNNGSIL